MGPRLPGGCVGVGQVLHGALGHLADEALLECGDGVAEQVRLPIQLPKGSLGDILGPAQRRDGLVQDRTQDPLLDGLLSRCLPPASTTC